MPKSDPAGDKGRSTITIDPRFEGPPGITLGGYISGLMAEPLDCDTVQVTMHKPTPMGKPLVLDTTEVDRVVLYEGETMLNEACPSTLELAAPVTIGFDEAARASRRNTVNPFPNCFGCGSGRSEADGLHLRSGPVDGKDVVAIDWTPPGAVVGGNEGDELSVRMALTAMECPIAKAMEIGGLLARNELIVLGRITTKLIRAPRVGEPCFFLGWPIDRVRRRIELAGMLNDRSGSPLIMARLTFVVLREGVTY